MKKETIKYIFAFTLVVLLLFQGKASAVLATNDYTIEKYDIDMVVNEDNTFDITERITAHFYVPKHRNI